MIEREVRPVMDKVLEMGDGDVAAGAVTAFEAGVMDIPWSPNRGCKSLVTPARDDKGCLRILDRGDMPIPDDVMAYHEERLRAQATKTGKRYGPDLAIDSVYELSEDIEKLLPFPLPSS